MENKQKNFIIIWWSFVVILFILAVVLYFYPNPNGWSSREVNLPQDTSGSQSNTGMSSEQNQSLGELVEVLDCTKSKKSGFKVEFTIKLADIKDPTKYKIKRQEVINLINLCYDVTLVEEYQVKPGEISTQEWKFKNKISYETRVFDKLKLFPWLELYDYTSVALDGGLTYFYVGDYNTIFDFYKDAKIEGFKPTPSPSENELIFTDIETTQKLLTIKFSRSEDKKILVNFDYSELIGGSEKGE